MVVGDVLTHTDVWFYCFHGILALIGSWRGTIHTSYCWHFLAFLRVALSILHTGALTIHLPLPVHCRGRCIVRAVEWHYPHFILLAFYLFFYFYFFLYWHYPHFILLAFYLFIYFYFFLGWHYPHFILLAFFHLFIYLFIFRVTLSTFHTGSIFFIYLFM